MIANAVTDSSRLECLCAHVHCQFMVLQQLGFAHFPEFLNIFVKYWPLDPAIFSAESTKLATEKAEDPKTSFCNDQTLTLLAHCAGNCGSKPCRGPSRRACVAGTVALCIRETVQESDSQNCLIMSWICHYSSLFSQRAWLSFLWHNYL